MSWLFSQALVVASLEEGYLDGELFVPSSTTPMPQAFLWRDKTTDAWSRFPSGMTCAPLTVEHGEALLMWSLAASPAKTSAAPGKVRASMAQGLDFGQKWQGSFAKFDPTTSSWKTAQCSLLGGLESYSETWPRSGSMRNGTSYLRQTLVPAIFESASGLWPTVRKSDGERGGRGDLLQAVKGHPNKHFRMPTMTLVTAKHPGRVKLKPGQQTSLGQHINSTEPIPGQLNPTWVEWFMGWPESWTDLAALETGKFLEWQLQHSVCFPAPESGS